MPLSYISFLITREWQGPKTHNELLQNPPNPFLSAGGYQIATRSSQAFGNMAGTTRSGASFNLPSLGSSEDDLDSGGSSRSKRGHSGGGGGSPSKKMRAGPNPAPPAPPIPTKNIRRPEKKRPMKELVAKWNKSARIGKDSETTKGWLKKTKKQRDAQGRVLRRARPGTVALREIRHYQRCQSFLISMAPFQRLVRELSEDCPVRHKDQPLRWQSNALFTLQTATESYMCGFFSDVNLCAHHRKVKTISRKDINVAIEVRGREHVGGKGTSADVGPTTTSDYFVSDGSERAGLEPRVRKTDYAIPHDWVAEMRAKVAVPPIPAGKGGGARRGKGGRPGGSKN